MQIMTAQAKWEQYVERKFEYYDRTCLCACAICSVILSWLICTAGCAVAGALSYFYVLSPSLIHTQIEACFEPITTSCFVSNISYSLKNSQNDCAHVFEFTFTVVPSEKVFVFTEE